MTLLFQTGILRRSTHNSQIIFGIPLGVLGAYLLINMINTLTHHRLFKPEWMIPVVVGFVVSLIGVIVITRLNKGKLSVYSLGSNELMIKLDFPSGEDMQWQGQFTTVGMYTKTYARYGMYYKNLALSILCNGIPVCLLRHQLGGIQTAPENFVQLEKLINPGGTEFWCKDTVKIDQLITSLIKPEGND